MARHSPGVCVRWRYISRRMRLFHREPRPLRTAAGAAITGAIGSGPMTSQSSPSVLLVRPPLGHHDDTGGAHGVVRVASIGGRAGCIALAAV